MCISRKDVRGRESLCRGGWVRFGKPLRLWFISLDGWHSSQLVRVAFLHPPQWGRCSSVIPWVSPLFSVTTSVFFWSFYILHSANYGMVGTKFTAISVHCFLQAPIFSTLLNWVSFMDLLLYRYQIIEDRNSVANLAQQYSFGWSHR